MREDIWGRNPGWEIIERESCGRNHRGGIVEGGSWRGDCGVEIVGH